MVGMVGAGGSWWWCTQSLVGREWWQNSGKEQEIEVVVRCGKCTTILPTEINPKVFVFFFTIHNLDNLCMVALVIFWGLV